MVSPDLQTSQMVCCTFTCKLLKYLFVLSIRVISAITVFVPLYDSPSDVASQRAGWSVIDVIYITDSPPLSPHSWRARGQHFGWSMARVWGSLDEFYYDLKYVLIVSKVCLNWPVNIILFWCSFSCEIVNSCEAICLGLGYYFNIAGGVNHFKLCWISG